MVQLKKKTETCQNVSYRKALEADSSYKPAAECLSIVLTDIGTSLKLAGNTQERIQKYYDAIKIDPHYAVISCSLQILIRCLAVSPNFEIAKNNMAIALTDLGTKSIGNSRWVHAMEWSGQKEFGASVDVPFKVDGSEAGLFKTHGPLSFL